MIKPEQVFIECELRIVGTNPESADYTNPRGDIYADVFMLGVYLNDGEIYRHFKTYRDEEKCFLFLEKVQDAVNDGKELNMEHWKYNRLAYGSEAYQKQGGEEELIRLESFEEQLEGFGEW